MGLSEHDRAILEFERSWWTRPGPKEMAIRDQLGMSPTRYRRLLASLVESDDAEAYDPLVIRRLRRARDQRRRARYDGRPAGGGRAR
jgi:hypothetical protein